MNDNKEVEVYPVLKQSIFDPGYRILFTSKGTGRVHSIGNTNHVEEGYISQFWAEMYFVPVKDD